jgi:hypothetical protein
MARNAQGTTINFGTSGFNAEITAVNGENIQRAVINTSHLGTTVSHTKMPSDLIDEGDVSLEFHFDSGDIPPISGDPETVTIAFPGGGGVTGSGFISSWSWGAPLDDKLTGTATLTWAGTATAT